MGHRYTSPCLQKSTMAEKKYLFFDIDGTLAAGGYGNIYYPESTLKALEKLREAGHFLAIATGRAEVLARGVMRDLGFENMVSDGGWGLTIEGKFLGVKPLPHDKVCMLVEECKEKGFIWGLQVDNTDVRLVPDGRFQEFTRDTYIKTKVVPGLDPADYPVIYKAYVACYEPDEQKLSMLKELPWGRYHKEYLFVEPSDKAAGIRAVMDHFHADYRDVIVFGDAVNDLSMFSSEWTNVAMGNAHPALKEAADLVTTDADKDGIWNACVRLGLFEPEETARNESKGTVPIDSFWEIRHSTPQDLPKIMEIYAYARSFMAAHGNPRQWGGTNWPPEELIRRDIAEERSYVCEHEGKVVGTFYYDFGEDIEPTYREITDGSWISESPYGVVHRIAGDGSVKGIGETCINWAFRKCHHLRIDTHGDNHVMQNLLKKLGFVHCGTIYVTEDNDPRLAYEKM